MEKDGARSLPSQSLIEGAPAFDLTFEIAHTNSNQVNFSDEQQEHSGPIAYFTASSLDLSYLSLKSHYTLTGYQISSFSASIS